MGLSRRPVRSDAAVSDTLGVVLMVAISVAMAGAMYVWMFGLSSEGELPPAFSLASDGGIRANGDKRFTVAAVHGDVMWNDIILKVDGMPLNYDDTLSGSLKYCVATSGACIPTATWQGTGTPVAAGHTLTIHDRDLSGKSLQVIDGATGAMILSVPIGSLQERS